MTSTLNGEEQIKFGKQILELKDILNDSLEFFKKNLLSFNGTRTQNHSHVFLDLLARFRYNTEGVLTQLDSFHNDYRQKTVINLILRSVCADILTTLYLFTFYEEGDSNNTALKNELDVISSEYFRFAIQLTEVDHEYSEKHGTPSEQTIESKVEELKKMAPHLFNSNGDFKSKKILRATTPDAIKSGLKEGGIFLTEAEKYNRIKDGEHSSFGYIFIMFKYYSQFQHVSEMTRKYIENKPFHDTYYLARTIDYMLEVSVLILKKAQSSLNDYEEESKNIRKKIHINFAQHI